MERNLNHHGEIIVKAYTAGELALLYGVSINTLRTWLKPHRNRVGTKNSRYYTPLQVLRIFECLGYPGNFIP